MELERGLQEQVREICDEGHDLIDRQALRDAFENFSRALSLVPEPRESYRATAGILAGLGEVYFRSKTFDQGKQAFGAAARCTGASGNPLLHLRLGQCEFQLGNDDRATDELARAYSAAGPGIFVKEDPRYLEFLKTRRKLPPWKGRPWSGGADLGKSRNPMRPRGPQSKSRPSSERNPNTHSTPAASAPTNLRRDRLAAFGVIPQMLVFALNALALGVDSIYLSRELATWLMPAAPLGLILAGVFTRDAWGLARGTLPAPSLRRTHRQLLWLAGGLVVAALWFNVRVDDDTADSVLALTLLAMTSQLLAAAVILVVAGDASARPMPPRLLKLTEAAVILAAWMVVVGLVPASRWHHRAQVRRMLRVETASRDPFIVALCHADLDKAASLLPSVGEQGAREAASCLSDDRAHKPAPGLEEYQASMRRTLAIEAVKQSDPLITGRARADGPCTVAEANLLRRLRQVAPQDVRMLPIEYLPTDCPESDPAGAPARGPSAAFEASSAASGS